MRRGFKTWAEGVAAEQRRLLGLRRNAALPGRRLAEHLDHLVIRPDQIPGMPADALAVLEQDGMSWSAATLPESSRVVIINPAHSLARQESDIMHELGHVLCGHEAKGFDLLNVLALRRYDQNQEEEATWLGGCLQLPRDALLWALGQGMDTPSIAFHYGASEELTTWRRRLTGVDAQLRRSRYR